MTELLKKHPILALIAIGFAALIAGLVIAVHAHWLFGEPLTQQDVDMWKTTALFLGSALSLVLVQVLLKLKGL